MIVLALLGSLAIILLGCELFTNGVEWIGNKLNLGEGVVGSVLAAVGTAMPETLIPVVAILFSGAEAGADIGVGAILGAPFMLGTLAMFVTGTAILIFASRGRRIQQMDVNHTILGRDMTFFFIAYIIAIGVAFLPGIPFRWVVSVVLLGVYAIYVLRQFSDESEMGDDLNPLHLSRAYHSTRSKLNPQYAPERLAKVHTAVDVETIEEISPFLHISPRLSTSIVQTLLGLACIIGGARFFVDSTQVLAQQIAVPALILALIIAPIATELPEKMNSVLWVRRGKDTLAMGNLTGAMVFQSCIPTAIGIAFTSWTIDAGSLDAFISAGMAMASAAIIFGVMRFRGKLTAKWLLTGGAFYGVYLALIISRL